MESSLRGSEPLSRGTCQVRKTMCADYRPTDVALFEYPARSRPRPKTYQKIERRSVPVRIEGHHRGHFQDGAGSTSCQYHGAAIY